MGRLLSFFITIRWNGFGSFCFKIFRPAHTGDHCIYIIIGDAGAAFLQLLGKQFSNAAFNIIDDLVSAFLIREILSQNRDYMTVPAAQIKSIKPTMTMVGGRVVYQSGK